MVRNCKLRCATHTQYYSEGRDVHWREYPASKPRKLLPSRNLSRRKSLAGRPLRGPAFNISEREKNNDSRLMAALITMALGGGVLAANLIELEKPYSRF